MKAIILAAGLGTRLRPITNDVPKCMVPVNGIRIIDKQIDNLLLNEITDIYVVAGYKADVLISHLKKTYKKIHIIDNKRYMETNNMYSLYLALPFVLNEDFLLMNADVYYDSNIIKGLLCADKSSLIACETGRYIEESMKITGDANKINHISKKIKESDYYAVSIDVYKISAQDGLILYDEVKNTIECKKDEISWTEVALDNIFDKTIFKPYIINGRWFEIDNHSDLSMASDLFEGDFLQKL